MSESLLHLLIVFLGCIPEWEIEYTSDSLCKVRGEMMVLRSDETHLTANDDATIFLPTKTSCNQSCCRLTL